MTQLLEELADLEHQQWMHWSQYVAENHDIPDGLQEKWEENWRPYQDLSEELKEKDRKWARKVHDQVLDRVITLVEQHIKECEDLNKHAHRHSISSLQAIVDDLETLKIEDTDDKTGDTE